MGAAGLTSSSIEMADKGGVGIKMNLDKVPQRETGMTPYEMMLSESQERMLMVLVPGKEHLALEIFQKWELDVAEVGVTTDTGRLVLTHNRKKVCDIPIAPLADDAPNLNRPHTKTPERPVLSADDARAPDDYNTALNTLITWRNLTCTGATPIAITDCLNFGNPERPDIMGQFVGCVEGMNEACRAFDYPVVSGNVSLYNETNGVAIPPTPAVGGVGLIEDLDVFTTITGAQEGDTLVLIGETQGWLGSSLYGREILGHERVENAPVYAPPPVDLAVEKTNGDYVRSLIKNRRVKAVHDLSDGGLAMSAAEMCFAAGIGAELKTAPAGVSLQGWLFGEDQARYLLAVDENSVNPVVSTAQAKGIPAQIVGKVTGGRLKAAGAFDVNLSDLKAANERVLPDLMASKA